jgi:hypothetical protein
MENLPFLTQSADPLSSRGAPPPLETDQQQQQRRAWTPVQEFDDQPPPSRRFVPAFDHQPRQQNVFDSLKDNQVALILIGIVIGVLIMNMRPIIVNPTK